MPNLSPAPCQTYVPPCLVFSGTFLYALQGGRRIDAGGTRMLPKQARESWEARYVEADGNCMWRACSLSFFGSDCYWLNLKLASLAYAAAHVAEICLLVPEGMVERHLRGTLQRGVRDARRRTQDDGSTKFVEKLLSRDTMLMASLARLCRPGAYAGQVASVVVSETFGIGVNMMHGMDMKARRRMDAGLVKDGAGQEVNREGFRWSYSHVPQSAVSGFRPTEMRLVKRSTSSW